MNRAVYTYVIFIVVLSTDEEFYRSLLKLRQTIWRTYLLLLLPALLRNGPQIVTKIQANAAFENTSGEWK